MSKTKIPAALTAPNAAIRVCDKHHPEQQKHLKLLVIGALTNTERQFIKYCCSDLAYKQIADLMCLSKRTVENMSARIFRHFDLHSRAGLVSFALQHGLY